MSAQPGHLDVERDGQDVSATLDALVAAGILRRVVPEGQPPELPPPAPAAPAPEGPDTRFTVTYRKGGQDITVDLDEVPDEELPEQVRRWRPAKTYARVEDIRFMAGQGETLAGVAERLSRLGNRLTAEAVERFLHRYGAHDVVWRLKANEHGEPEPDSADWWRDMGIGRVGRDLSPEEVEAARRQWVKGPQEDSGRALPRTGGRRGAARGVKGRRL